MDPEGARFVTRCGDDAASTSTTDHDRATAQLRALALFHGREELIEVEV